MHALFERPQRRRSLDRPDSPVLAKRSHTIAVVDGNDTAVASIETAMGAPNHTLLLLDSRAHAYADIRRLQPSLVVLCIRLDSPGPVQLLTMLAMDPDTGSIPVSTIAVENDDDADDAWEMAGGEPPTGLWVN